MSDIADASDKLIEAFTASAVARACSKPAMKATGQCRFCDKPVDPGLFFVTGIAGMTMKRN
jgi:hypothetical protein